MQLKVSATMRGAGVVICSILVAISLLPSPTNASTFIRPVLTHPGKFRTINKKQQQKKLENSYIYQIYIYNSLKRSTRAFYVSISQFYNSRIVPIFVRLLGAENIYIYI